MTCCWRGDESLFNFHVALFVAWAASPCFYSLKLEDMGW